MLETGADFPLGPTFGAVSDGYDGCVRGRERASRIPAKIPVVRTANAACRIVEGSGTETGSLLWKEV
jgi:hypothetical protein